MPILPLEGSKLVYGSDDAGRTVHNSDTEFADYMRLVAKELNLAEHNVNGAMLCTGGDVEGHVVTSDRRRRYLLDLARWAPPEDPRVTHHLPKVHSSIFYRMLRPEFLRREMKENSLPALSSDTFSGWGMNQGKHHASNLRKATAYMCSQTVTKAVSRIMETAKGFNINDIPTGVNDEATLKFPDTIDISAIFHQVGLPMRHMVLVLQHEKQEFLRGVGDLRGHNMSENLLASAASVRNAIIGLVQSRINAEMVARSIKHKLKDLLRRCDLKDLPKKLASFFNSIIGDNQRFWNRDIARDLDASFGFQRFLLPEDEWKDVKTYFDRCAKCTNKGFPDALLKLAKTQGLSRASITKDWIEQQRRMVDVLWLDAQCAEDLWRVLWYMAHEELKMTYFESVIAGFNLKHTQLDPTGNFVEMISELWQETAGLKCKNKPNVVRDAALLRSWQARLSRFQNPPRFDWGEAYLRGCRRNIQGTRRLKSWGNQPEYRNKFFTAQTITRRHFRLILSHALESTGVRIDVACCQQLLKWCYTEAAFPMRLPSSAFRMPEGKLLCPRSKDMDIMEWAALNSNFIAAQKLLNALTQDSKTSPSWSDIVAPLARAMDSARRLKRSGGAGSVSYLALRILRTVIEFRTAPWHESVEATHTKLTYQFGAHLDQARKVNSRLLRESFEIEATQSMMKFFIKTWELTQKRQTFKFTSHGTFPRHILNFKNLETLCLNNIDAVNDELFSLTSLRSLSFNFGRVRRIPSGLGRLSKLETLDVTGNKINAIPDSISQLPKLKTFMCANNCLESIPVGIGDTSLEVCILDSNLISSLPNVFKKLTNLRELRCSTNHLASLPETLGECSKLQVLDIHQNELVSLPNSMGRLESLLVLNLEKNQLQSLPEGLRGLCSLAHLNLGFQGDLKVSDEISTMTCLQWLSLDGNNLSALPDDIGDLRLLKTLKANRNNLKSLPESIGELEALERLELEQNKLRSLPATAGNLVSLLSLKLSLNILKSLPKDLSGLKSLERLECRNNLLYSIPHSFGTLQSIQYMDFRRNKLTSLPKAVTELKSLQRIDVRGNMFSSKDESLYSLAVIGHKSSVRVSGGGIKWDFTFGGGQNVPNIPIDEALAASRRMKKERQVSTARGKMRGWRERKEEKLASITHLKE
mmetsp:Transcript_36210/g.70372  ORF Transcript_36210/g.70372 Transcript_36210/m.70372 type:complete len:1152 (+) Transcript_36210:44-3499(+)